MVEEGSANWLVSQRVDTFGRWPTSSNSSPPGSTPPRVSCRQGHRVKASIYWDCRTIIEPSVFRSRVPVLVNADTALGGVAHILLDGGPGPAAERAEVAERGAAIVVRAVFPKTPLNVSAPQRTRHKQRSWQPEGATYYHRGKRAPPAQLPMMGFHCEADV